MIADYAARYGHMPRPSDPWALFVGLLRECVRFDARDQLRALDGPMMAVSALFADGHVGDRILMRQDLARLAYGDRP